MARILWLVLLICVQQSWSQEPSSTEASKDDPVALLLSNLRSLVENPGAPFEDLYEFSPLEEGRRKEPMYGRPRQDYFKRIKENYGKLQKDIGVVLGDLPKKLLGVDVKSKGGSSTVDVKIPFFPVHVKVKNSKTQPPKEPVAQVPGFLDVFHNKPKEESPVEKSTKVGVSIPSLPIEVKVKSSQVQADGEPEGDDGSKSSEESRKVRPPLSKVSTKVKVGDIVKVKVKVESDSKVVKRFGLRPNEWIVLGESPGGRGKRDAVISKFATEEQKEVFSKAYYDFMADPVTDEEDPGDVELDIIDPVSSRLLSEVLYSEEAFDNMTKEAIKNAKWALDSNLAPSKIIDKLDAVAKLILSRHRPRTKSKRTPEDARLQVKRDAAKLPKLPFSRAEELPTESTEEKTIDTIVEPPIETVLIALTEGGIPVQIRIGPEVENPYRFLHKVLSVSQVVLKIQMKDILRNPAESDEAESEEVPPPVLHVDMSDLKQRSSFLRTLRKFRSDQS